ncbi:MAG: efflux RND transporter periplasmic adaptor subunit [Defluviitaleaceae bacterium]|nr:efflux RND transporter periplasmic adaptor subunit [Defluviitaleaceae bacterium]
MTSSIKAIFIKQFKDISKNSDILSQFIIYPVMAFLMTHVIDISMPGMSDSLFVTMFAGMFVGMAFIGAVATAIAEDIEKNSLRFLLMAGVKSHEYLIGIGGVFLTIGVIGSVAFAVMIPDMSMAQTLMMLLSMVLGISASILIGAIIGMTSKNQQSAVGTGVLAGMIISFGPFIANMSQNDTLQSMFRILYTMNFVDENANIADAIQSFGIIFANIVVLALIFTWVYGKRESSKKGGFVMSKKAVVMILAAALIGGAGIGAFMWHNAGFIATEDAHVATTLIPVSANGAGIMERFTVQEGQHVNADEVLGWVEGGEAMRAPLDGLIMQTNVVQGQLVSSMETVAVISDTSNIHIRANIEETDILNVQVGQRAYVTIDTFGNQRFAGYVSSIGNAALPDTSLHNSRTTLMIPIEVNLVDDVDLDRLIGVNARVRIPLRS